MARRRTFESLPRIGDEDSVVTSSEPISNTLVGQRDRPCLTVVAGKHVGKMYKLPSGKAVLGRASDCHVQIIAPGISRHHALIDVDGDDRFLLDLGSANGTRLNEVKVNGRRPLKPSDKIELGGNTVLKFAYHDELDDQFQERMYDAALRDDLTGAYNKRYLVNRLAEEMSYARRRKATLALVVFDLDHFKRINDRYGHLAGDHVLRRFCERVMPTLRLEDFFARYGGEEFILVCRGAEATEAYAMAERLRRLVASRPFHCDDEDIPVTISAGVAAFPQASVDSVSELIELADQALYDAKRNGRNRVMTWHADRRAG